MATTHPVGEPASLLRARHRHHPWRVAIAAVGVLGLGVFAYFGGAYFFRSHPGPKSVSSAVREFHSSTTLRPSTTRAFKVPAAGVYTATGHGKASISFPPNSQADGKVMPITVSTLPAGCWRWHLAFNTAHWQEYDYCPKGGQLMLVGQRNWQSWDFGTSTISNTGTYRCDPPSPIVVDNPRVGQVFQHHCVGDNTAAPGTSIAAGPARTVGRETMRVGGRTVDVIRQTRVETISGPQHGHLSEVWWFTADTGLPVRCVRHYTLTSSSPIGNIDYHEDGTWQLRDLQTRG